MLCWPASGDQELQQDNTPTPAMLIPTDVNSGADPPRGATWCDPLHPTRDAQMLCWPAFGDQECKTLARGAILTATLLGGPNALLASI